MSNYFPDGRPIQRMMHALSGEAVCIGVTGSITGNIRNEVSDDWTSAKYPNYQTQEAFDAALSKVNLFHIIGGSVSFLGSTNSITVPTSGLIITGAQNFQTMDVSGSKIILYIKPTP